MFYSPILRTDMLVAKAKAIMGIPTAAPMLGGEKRASPNWRTSFSKAFRSKKTSMDRTVIRPVAPTGKLKFSPGDKLILLDKVCSPLPFCVCAMVWRGVSYVHTSHQYILLMVIAPVFSCVLVRLFRCTKHHLAFRVPFQMGWDHWCVVCAPGLWKRLVFFVIKKCSFSFEWFSLFSPQYG